MNFTHVMIKTKNIKKAIDFYTKIMDMKIVNQKEIGKMKLCFLSNDNGLELELMQEGNLPLNTDTKLDSHASPSLSERLDSTRKKNQSTIHLGFVIDSMEDFSKKIKAFGYDFSQNPFDITGKGSNIAFLYDEDGYEIEVIEKVVW